MARQGGERLGKEGFCHVRGHLHRHTQQGGIVKGLMRDGGSVDMEMGERGSALWTGGQEKKTNER